jgi:hypothetical protein
MGSPAFANYIPPMPLDAQLAEADLVVVGRLGPRVRCDFDWGADVCAEILADTVIKGSAPALAIRRYLVLSSPIMEWDIRYIVIPHSALLFMSRLRRGVSSPLGDPEYYAPLRASRSVVLLNGLNITDIQHAMCPLRPVTGQLRSTEELSAC